MKLHRLAAPLGLFFLSVAPALQGNMGNDLNFEDSVLWGLPILFLSFLGFSLVELIIVATIFWILGAVALTNLYPGFLAIVGCAFFKLAHFVPWCRFPKLRYRTGMILGYLVFFWLAFRVSYPFGGIGGLNFGLELCKGNLVNIASGVERYRDRFHELPGALASLVPEILPQLPTCKVKGYQEPEAYRFFPCEDGVNYLLLCGRPQTYHHKARGIASMSVFEVFRLRGMPAQEEGHSFSFARWEEEQKLKRDVPQERLPFSYTPIVSPDGKELARIEMTFRPVFISGRGLFIPTYATFEDPSYFKYFPIFLSIALFLFLFPPMFMNEILR